MPFDPPVPNDAGWTDVVVSLAVFGLAVLVAGIWSWRSRTADPSKPRPKRSR